LAAMTRRPFRGAAAPSYDQLLITMNRSSMSIVQSPLRSALHGGQGGGHGPQALMTSNRSLMSTTLSPSMSPSLHEAPQVDPAPWNVPPLLAQALEVVT